MSQLIGNYYILLFKLTNSKPASYYISVALVSILTVITLYGLSSLLADAFPTKSLVTLFSFPLSFVSGGGIFLLNILFLPPAKFVNRPTPKKYNYALVILSIGISFAVYAYSYVVTKLL